MASEYLKWKYRDVKPDPPPPPMTKKEKLENWFYYYKWWLLAGVVLVYIVGSILWSALGIGKVKPDYIFAYIGSSPMPESSADALEAALEELGQDTNGDGKVQVELRQYIVDRGGDPETAFYYDQAANVALTADINDGESYFFLMENGEKVQRSYQILAQADGTPPPEGDESVSGKVFRWGDCPALSGVDIGWEALANLSLGRRCFYDTKQSPYRDGCADLWNILTEGVKP